MCYSFNSFTKEQGTNEQTISITVLLKTIKFIRTSFFYFPDWVEFLPDIKTRTFSSFWESSTSFSPTGEHTFQSLVLLLCTDAFWLSVFNYSQLIIGCIFKANSKLVNKITIKQIITFVLLNLVSLFCLKLLIRNIILKLNHRRNLEGKSFSVLFIILLTFVFACLLL